MSSLSDMFHRLLTAQGRSRSAKTIEVFGWLILLEGALVLLVPHFVAVLLHLPLMVDQAINYFRLLGLLVTGVGMLYIVSGRVNAAGFVFATGSAPGTVCHGDSLVSGNRSWTVGADFFASRFWQLFVDAHNLACRVSG